VKAGFSVRSLDTFPRMRGPTQSLCTKPYTLSLFRSSPTPHDHRLRSHITPGCGNVQAGERLLFQSSRTTSALAVVKERPTINPGVELRAVHGFADTVSLGALSTKILENLPGFLPLNTLGNHSNFETAAEFNNGVNDASVAPSRGDVLGI